MTFATDMEYDITSTYLFTSYQLTFKMHKTRIFSLYSTLCHGRIIWNREGGMYYMTSMHLHDDENLILFIYTRFRIFLGKIVVNFSWMHYACETTNLYGFQQRLNNICQTQSKVVGGNVVTRFLLFTKLNWCQWRSR